MGAKLGAQGERTDHGRFAGLDLKRREDKKTPSWARETLGIQSRAVSLSTLGNSDIYVQLLSIVASGHDSTDRVSHENMSAHPTPNMPTFWYTIQRGKTKKEAPVYWAWSLEQRPPAKTCQSPIYRLQSKEISKQATILGS